MKGKAMEERKAARKEVTDSRHGKMRRSLLTSYQKIMRLMKRIMNAFSEYNVIKSPLVY